MKNVTVPTFQLIFGDEKDELLPDDFVTGSIISSRTNWTEKRRDAVAVFGRTEASVQS